MRLKADGIRITVDDGEDRMKAKIRNAEMHKIPYVLVVGDKEEQAKAVAVRGRNEGNLGPMSLEAFLEMTREARTFGRARLLFEQDSTVP